MQLTKFEHACFTIEKDGVSIVVDPGHLTHDFIMPKKVAAVFITHNHGDHVDNQLVITILREHPSAILLADESVLRNFENERKQVVVVGQTITIEGIDLSFVGGIHEPIDVSIPTPPNIGVIIDGHLYYPGDSNFVPAQPVRELLLPVSAPWLAISDAMNLLRVTKPHHAFPTHDAILSTEGQAVIDGIILNVTSGLGIEYQRINGKTIRL
jgi:L-ascorbate metabolism protein UlaG (beta-lactamase superfamily)